jgi:hypothetical protein
MTNTTQNDELTEALRRLKEDDEAMSASPAVEARLLQEVRGLQRHERRWNPRLAAALATAAIVVVTLSIGWWLRSAQRPAVAVTEVAQEVTTGFFPLFYGSVPAAQTHLVRLELPRESLARFGLMSADGIDHSSGTVLADVLVGDDGLARAVRFVRKLSQEQRQ